MAKVTNNGDFVRFSWTGPNGRRMVLTVHGRLLMRYGGQKRYTVLRHHCSHDEAKRLAGMNMLTAHKEI